MKEEEEEPTCSSSIASSSNADSSWFLGVHIGAGNHSSLREQVYCELMQEALEKGQHFLQSNKEKKKEQNVTLAVQIVHEMLTVFERNSLTNAGRGSNLTEQKTVECEASIICGKDHLIGVCANVQGVAEPSSLAFEILKNAHKNSASKHPFGREPPLVIVGKEARRYARQSGLEVANSDDEEALTKYQVTPSTEAFWTKWNDRFETLRQKQQQHEEEETECSLLDTVGAICMDPNGNVASGLSSGGIAFKQCGRVGIAGSVRMGCHADSKKGFAVACSGRGEHFLRTNFVSRLSHRLGKKSKQGQALVDDAIRKTFQETTPLNGGIPMEGGVLFLSTTKSHKNSKDVSARKKRKTQHKAQEENRTVVVKGLESEHCRLHFGAAFTTPSMGVGYVHSQAPKVYHTEILRAPHSKKIKSKKSGQLFFHANQTIL